MGLMGMLRLMLEVRDPADVRSVVGEVPAMTAAEVAAAYARARTAFAAWRRTGPLDRAAVLARCAGLIRARAEDGAVTLVRENGKTLAEARVEVTKTADFLDYYASFARQPWGELLADARPGTADQRPGRAGRRGARHLPVERPADHPGAQARPGADRRQRGAAQGRLADPAASLLWLAGLLAEAGLPDGVRPGDHRAQQRDLRRAARLARRGDLHRVERGRRLPAPHAGRRGTSGCRPSSAARTCPSSSRTPTSTWPPPPSPAPPSPRRASAARRPAG